MEENCYEIFNLLKREANDKISLFNKHLINEIIYYLDKYFLEYRSFLGFEENDTFGIEIECESEKSAKCAVNEIKPLINLDGFKVRPDYSIVHGCEVTSAVLTDTIVSWRNILYVCSLLKSRGYYIGQRTAGHVHVGAHILGEKVSSWFNFIKLWAAYEKVIYRFCYGEYLRERSVIMSFAPPIAGVFFGNYKELKDNKFLTSLDIVKSVSHGVKSQSINFLNVYSLNEYGYGNTIEFRCPNGSLNPIIWQNNINLFVHLFKYASSSSFDNDLVSKRFESIDVERVSLSYYSNVFLEEALELCDMIFDNNLDKIYFLRQYLKYYEIGQVYLESAKPFVKSLK